MADKILPEDEHTILRIAARNPTLREAAVDMGVSYQTLKNWLSNYYRDTGYSGLPQALYYEFIDTDEH